MACRNSEPLQRQRPIGHALRHSPRGYSRAWRSLGTAMSCLRSQSGCGGQADKFACGGGERRRPTHGRQDKRAASGRTHMVGWIGDSRRPACPTCWRFRLKRQRSQCPERHLKNLQRSPHGTRDDDFDPRPAVTVTATRGPGVRASLATCRSSHVFDVERYRQEGFCRTVRGRPASIPVQCPLHSGTDGGRGARPGNKAPIGVDVAYLASGMLLHPLSNQRPMRTAVQLPEQPLVAELQLPDPESPDSRPCPNNSSSPRLPLPRITPELSTRPVKMVVGFGSPGPSRPRAILNG